MSGLTPVALPPSVYQTDLDSDLTEHLQWYGPGKLHPTHLHDTLDNGRYVVVHKLDHSNHSLSWLCRDTRTSTWRRIDVVHASPDVTRVHERGVNGLLAQRPTTAQQDNAQAAADARGLPLRRFFERGPNGRHLCIVYPLNGGGNCFRWSVRDEAQLNEAWLVRQCGGTSLDDKVQPGSVHAITEAEMLAILGRPRVIPVTQHLRQMANFSECVLPDQLPQYLVLRPDKIDDDLDSWLTSQPFTKYRPGCLPRLWQSYWVSTALWSLAEPWVVRAARQEAFVDSMERNRYAQSTLSPACFAWVPRAPRSIPENKGQIKPAKAKGG